MDSHDSATPGTFFGATLAETDRVLAQSIQDELHRQQHRIELIASENIVSRLDSFRSSFSFMFKQKNVLTC